MQLPIRIPFTMMYKLLQREQHNDVGEQARRTVVLYNVVTSHDKHCTCNLFKPHNKFFCIDV